VVQNRAPRNRTSQPVRFGAQRASQSVPHNY